MTKNYTPIPLMLKSHYEKDLMSMMLGMTVFAVVVSLVIKFIMSII